MSNKILFLVFMTLGFFNSKTQETTVEPFLDLDFDLSGVWYVLNATGLAASSSHEPRCWSIVLFKSPSNEYKGFSIFLDNKTNKQVSSFINAVQVDNVGQIVFKITSPANAEQSEVEYYIRLENESYVSHLSLLKTADARESIGGFDVTEDVYSLVNNTIWAGCGQAFDYSMVEDYVVIEDEIEEEIPPEGDVE
uniref:Uncharacterized protein n=1 Tax=Meteorus pulchricornis TaxID=51522 RepID=H7CHJ9_9HYME|nr:hypothetical protein [Meteorus pulchricornis]